MAEFEEKLNAILGNEAAMGQIMALAQSFSGTGAGQPESQIPSSPTPPDYIPVTEANPLSMLDNLDPRLIQIGMQLLGEYQGENSQSVALLAALRPFLRPERYEKLDRAIQLARISRVIRVLLQTFGEGEGDV